MTLRLAELDPRHDPGLADHLLDLQVRSYAVEAELIGDDRIPALHETVEDIVASTLAWLGVLDEDPRGTSTVIGAVGYAVTADEIDIDRLVVDPLHLRRGAGRMLVAAVLERARAQPVTVSTGRGNHPARTLYERLGFVRTGETQVLPGLWVTHYRWAVPATS